MKKLPSSLFLSFCIAIASGLPSTHASQGSLFKIFLTTVVFLQGSTQLHAAPLQGGESVVSQNLDHTLSGLSDQSDVFASSFHEEPWNVDKEMYEQEPYFSVRQGRSLLSDAPSLSPTLEPTGTPTALPTSVTSAPSDFPTVYPNGDPWIVYTFTGSPTVQAEGEPNTIENNSGGTDGYDSLVGGKNSTEDGIIIAAICVGGLIVVCFPFCAYLYCCKDKRTKQSVSADEDGNMVSSGSTLTKSEQCAICCRKARRNCFAFICCCCTASNQPPMIKVKKKAKPAATDVVLTTE